MPISTEVPRRILNRIGRGISARGTGGGPTRPGDSVARAKHFVVTWAIPDNYGGMTNALFHRSRALAREAGLNVTVLTFDWRPNYEDAREALQRRAALTKGVELLNLWEWLADLDDRRLRALGDRQSREDFKPLDASEAPNQNRMDRRRRYSQDGKTLLQQDYYRQDGSLLVSDRFDVAVAEGKKTVRRIFLCDSSGKPVRTLTNSSALYHLWLDQLTAGDDAFVIVDSKFAADFIAQYRRSNVTTMYMVHGAHIDWRVRSPYAPLSRVRRDAFAGLERFDGVVLLTDRQKFHTAMRLGDFGNLTVIPNSWNPGSQKVETKERDEARGIIVASLDSRKQVDHAVRAVSALNTPEKASSLHIFGSGSQVDFLSQLISDNQMGESIHLEGFTNNVAGEFARSSYS
ncbi:hypothetical protein, partial [Arthrobacter sp. H14]|uniref:hypothetical protein n=1 Tax=Arthrobacter sp. H14 TaxID=1312959 RepID=UPI00138AAF2C